MQPLLIFSIKMTAFMAVFLIASYFLFRHIRKIREKHGEPEDKKNNMMILKHFFFQDKSKD